MCDVITCIIDKISFVLWSIAGVYLIRIQDACEQKDDNSPRLAVMKHLVIYSRLFDLLSNIAIFGIWVKYQGCKNDQII